ncbi:protein of unknown function [Marivirga sericea]|uniref:DUF4249 domain-containing protein n=1 Tax=Marivirga sericea TaxID=1028 RepID=A0A1X7JLR0_9BACT|nr:DUF4249 domain-containing protein [Marivirga sericea]SMG28771.1 protein of unknown function [Marivirga sericea]
MRVNLLYIVPIFLFYGCIDPLDIEVNDRNSRLVVMGEITNLPEAYQVVLQRTSDYETLVNPMEENATVSVTDENGLEYFFKESKPGIYRSCPTEFVGKIGQSYKLRIETSNDIIYESEVETLLSTGEIDKVYYRKSQRQVEVNDYTYLEEGIKVFCDFKDTETEDYFKLDWQGTYKFQSAPMDNNNRYCWNTEFAKFDINLYNDQFSNNSLLKDFEITYLSDGLRFSEDYSFQVRLKSLSKGAFKFWTLIKDQFENDGSIFSALPAQIESNINSLTNAEEKVLGYFVVSSVDTKRIRIPSTALSGVNEAALACKQFSPTDPLPEYCFNCTKYENSEGEEPTFW